MWQRCTGGHVHLTRNRKAWCFCTNLSEPQQSLSFSLGPHGVIIALECFLFHCFGKFLSIPQLFGNYYGTKPQC